MARGKGDTGRAVVLDADQIKRLIRIAGTTMHGERDQTVVVLSYWLGLRAKELASLKIGDVYDAEGDVRQVLHLKAGYTKRARVRDVYLSSERIRKRLKEYREFCLSSREFAIAHRSTGAAQGRRSLFEPVGEMAEAVCLGIDLNYQNAVAASPYLHPNKKAASFIRGGFSVRAF